jgi:hypothetical protein
MVPDRQMTLGLHVPEQWEPCRCLITFSGVTGSYSAELIAREIGMPLTLLTNKTSIALDITLLRLLIHFPFELHFQYIPTQTFGLHRLFG